MYERSAASASSNSVPANALPGSISAKKLRADRSSRFNVRLMKCITSRTNQSDCCSKSTSSASSTSAGSPSAFSTNRADRRLVLTQPQQRVVELAEDAQRPELIAGGVNRLAASTPPAPPARGR